MKNEKLTLRLEEELIVKAKQAARERGTSVSRMVASFFENIESPPTAEGRYGEITTRLRGALKPEDNRLDADEEEYSRYLEDKHG